MNAPSDESHKELKASVPDVAVHAAVEKAPELRAPRTYGTAAAIWIIALIALIAALYLARAFLVPLLFGILVSYTLAPVVRLFERCHIPRVLGAAFTLAMLVGGISWITFSLSGDAVAVVEKLPDAARKLRQNLSSLRTGGLTALQHVQEAADELQGAAADAGLKSEPTVVITRESELGSWLRDFMLAQSALLITFGAQTPVVLLLTYFLLASGTHFRRKLLKVVGPSLTRKKDVLRILEEVDVQVQHYLLIMLGSNTVVALLTWLAFEMLGLDHASVWGVAAGVLHFIPYLGTVTIALASGISGLLQFGSIPLALAIATISALVSGLVGLVFMTWLQGRFARVNTAVLFIALLFFGWLWGMAGLLLGAPLLAIAKAVCDRVDLLKPVGELLGR
jgi:predicted PurR-regulated permease PerM